MAILSAAEAAQYLGVVPATVYSAAQRGRIGDYVDGAWMFTTAELDVYRAQRRRGRPAKQQPAGRVQTAGTELDEWWTAQKTRTYLGVTKQRVYQLAAMLGQRHGKKWLFRRQAVIGYERARNSHAGRQTKR